jgi:hypothetical protein
MKKLAVGLYVTVALFGLFGAVVFFSVPPDARQLTDGYGVSEMGLAANGAAAIASVQTAK